MERWHDWEIKEEIGEGSFAKVYRIERKAFGRTFEAALKVIKIPANRSEFDNAISEGMSEEDAKAYFRDMAKAFSNEFAFMSELKGNSNIVSFEDFEVVPHDDGFSWDVFIRMELLEPFTSRLKGSGVSREEAVELGIDMCRALELCEQKNIIHRDIKPANIFISPQGTYKLGDFGIARELEKTSAGLSKKGTYSYMAPEIYRGGEYGPNADIYSLGMVLYRLLNNNRLPFLPEYPAKIKYTDTEEANRRRLSGEALPLPANADDELGRIILKACAFDPADRYKRASEMRKDLDAYRTDNEIQADQIQQDSEKTVWEESPVIPAEDDERTVAVMAVPEPAPEEEKPAPEVVRSAPAEPKKVPLVTKPVEVVTEAAPAENRKGSSAGAKVKREIKSSPKAERKKPPLKITLIIAAATLAIIAAIFVLSGGLDPYRKDESVYISDKEITNKMISVISHDSRANYIHFDKCTISDEAMQKLGQMKGVISLDISECTGFTSFDPLADMEVDDLHLTGSIGDEDPPCIDGMISKDFSVHDNITLSHWKTEDGLNSISCFGGTTAVMMSNITGDIDMNHVTDNNALKSLRIFECTAKDGDFSPLSKCTGIKNIEATECGIREISWMKPMTGLTSVILNNNEITSLAGLENHQALYTLEAEENQITDLSGLSGCSDLATLRLNNNEINDISGLSGCSNLGTFEIANSKVSDISALSGCTELRRLDATDNEIADISPLSSCEQMTHLYLSGNSVGSLDACSNMIDLEAVNAANNKIQDVKGLSNTTQLNDVDLSGNEIADISALGKNQDNLEQIKLGSNKIKDISALNGCTKLTLVSIGNNQIKDIAALAGMPMLVYLSAGKNEISDITALSDSAMLAYTDLGDNQIKDISPLDGHTAANQILMLQNNQISDISALPTTVGYNLLSLYGNPVSDLSRIGEFESVNMFSSYLYLSWNDKTDYSPVALAGYQKVTITDTPLDKRAPLMASRENIKTENGQNTMVDVDYLFKTKEEADADMDTVRKEARASENVIDAGLTASNILGD